MRDQMSCRIILFHLIPKCLPKQYQTDLSRQTSQSSVSMAKQASSRIPTTELSVVGHKERPLMKISVVKQNQIALLDLSCLGFEDYDRYFETNWKQVQWERSHNRYYLLLVVALADDSKCSSKAALDRPSCTNPAWVGLRQINSQINRQEQA